MKILTPQMINKVIEITATLKSDRSSTITVGGILKHYILESDSIVLWFEGDEGDPGFTAEDLDALDFTVVVL